MSPETKRGVRYDPAALDRVERRFWRDMWNSVPHGVAEERGIELRSFGQVQTTTVRDRAEGRMVNLVLGAAEDAGAGGEGLPSAVAWTADQAVSAYVPVTPG